MFKEDERLVITTSITNENELKNYATRIFIAFLSEFLINVIHIIIDRKFFSSIDESARLSFRLH